jgi:very-short-patch-repair endonuclease
MSKRYNIEEVRQISLNLGTKFLDTEYENNHTLYLFECIICKKPVKKTFKDVLRGHLSCIECSCKSVGENRRYIIEEVKEKAISVGCEFLDNEYISSKHNHLFLCAKCKKNTFKRTLNDVLTKKRNLCKECSEESYNKKQKISQEKFEEYKIYFEKSQGIKILTDYQNYKNFNKKNLICYCNVCNNTRNMSLSQLTDLQSAIGCGCSYISCGEKLTLEFLEKNGIEYEFQKRLPIGLYADFEIKLENNKVLLLEIDGSQHYLYRKQFNKTHKEFVHKQENDKLKEMWYINNGFDVIRIKYEKGRTVGWKNDDIEYILNEILLNKYGVVKRKQPNINYNILNVASIHTMSKKILVYTLDGAFYKEYQSYNQCIDELKISNLNKSRDTKTRCGDYMIRDYEENYPLHIEPYDGKLRKIKVYKNKEYLGTFNSLREIHRALGLNRDRISDYLKGKLLNFNNGYHFEYC